MKRVRNTVDYDDSDSADYGITVTGITVTHYGDIRITVALR